MRSVLLAVTLIAVVGAVPVAADETVPTESACPVRSLPATDFRDADGTHGDAIRCLFWYGLTKGRTPERYRPAAEVTRGQFASLVARMVEDVGGPLPSPDQRAFDDSAGTVHGDALEQLAAVGILRGKTPWRSAPEEELSRGQAATVLVRMVEHLEGEELPQGTDAFGDDDGSVHEPAIDRSAAAGLVRGVGSREYAPGDAISRGQSATLLARALSRFVADERRQVPAEPSPRWDVSRLPADVRREMTGVTWRQGCPVDLEELRLVVLTHRGFDGRLHRGELVVHQSVTGALGEVFPRLQEEDVPLERVERVVRYGGDDDRSMAANNSSAFNCRRITGGGRFSDHSYGTAIDLNPVQNPYVRGDTVLPPSGGAYRDRSDVRPGMIVEGDAITRAFDDIGWEWGGRWSSPIDYMHFSASGG